MAPRRGRCIRPARQPSRRRSERRASSMRSRGVLPPACDSGPTSARSGAHGARLPRPRSCTQAGSPRREPVRHEPSSWRAACRSSAAAMAFSFSWWGKRSSRLPMWTSKFAPRYFMAMAVVCRCQEGRRLPQSVFTKAPRLSSESRQRLKSAKVPRVALSRRPRRSSAAPGPGPCGVDAGKPAVGAEPREVEIERAPLLVGELPWPPAAARAPPCPRRAPAPAGMCSAGSTPSQAISSSTWSRGWAGRPVGRRAGGVGLQVAQVHHLGDGPAAPAQVAPERGRPRESAGPRRGASAAGYAARRCTWRPARAAAGQAARGTGRGGCRPAARASPGPRRAPC
jgi:hypothetical protein